MKNPTFLLLYIILSYCTAASAQQEKIFHSYDSSAKTQSEKSIAESPEHELDNQTHRTHKRQNDLYCCRRAASAGRERTNLPPVKGRIQGRAC